MAMRIREERGLKEVALSGGVFQNIFLLTGTYEGLSKEGFKVYVHEKVPTNDGGLSLGQALIAICKIKHSFRQIETEEKEKWRF
ncbi:MAG TPA: hypothetical protein EYP78_07125 [Candidatus Omnitrophica bacterium]|nr:hypothetical protein [Candidatus Omnitrophota bacterium]